MVADFSQSEAGPATPVTPGALDLVSEQAEVDELERAFVEAENAEAFTNTIVPAPAVMALPVGEDEFLESRRCR